MAGLWTTAAHPQFWVWSHDSQWLRGCLRARHFLKWSSLVAQWWRANAGDPGMIPDWEDPLEEEMATHASILAWEIPRTEYSGRLQSIGSQTVRHDWATKQQSLKTPKLIFLPFDHFFKLTDCRVVVFYIPLNSVHPWITSPTTTPQLQ